MAYIPMAETEAQSMGGEFGLLEPGAYIAVITEAYFTKSKKGDAAMVIKYDIADGDHKGFFSAQQYPPQEWLMAEGKGAPYSRYRLDCITTSNSSATTTFDAVKVYDYYAMQYINGGKIGDLMADHFKGRYFGVVINIEDYEYKGEAKQRNYIAEWHTAQEIKAGQYTDKNGTIKQISVPKAHKKGKPQGVQSTPTTQAPGSMIPPTAAPQPFALQQPATMQQMHQMAYGMPQVPAPAPADGDLLAEDCPF